MFKLIENKMTRKDQTLVVVALIELALIVSGLMLVVML